MTSCIIGKIGVGGLDFSADIEYLNALPKQAEEYDEFAQGYWKNVSLVNSTGDASDSMYVNSGRAFGTEHFRKCPAIEEFVRNVFDFEALRMVRARNLVDGLVVPHKDFVELDSEKNYFRVFVPIERNDGSFHSDVGGVFNMKPGDVWFLDASIIHSAVNFSVNSRMFICLDFVFDGDFSPSDIFREGAGVVTGGEVDYIDRKALSDREVCEIIDSVSMILNRDTFKDVLFMLSKYHFKRDIGVGDCFDWLQEAAKRAGDELVIRKAASLRRYLIEERELGERFTINNW